MADAERILSRGSCGRVRGGLNRTGIKFPRYGPISGCSYPEGSVYSEFWIAYIVDILETLNFVHRSCFATALVLAGHMCVTGPGRPPPKPCMLHNDVHNRGRCQKQSSINKSLWGGCSSQLTVMPLFASVVDGRGIFSF